MLESMDKCIKYGLFCKAQPALQSMLLPTCSRMTQKTLQIRSTQVTDFVENQYVLYKMAIVKTGVDQICREILTEDTICT